MEQDLGIPSALFAAPVREIVELGKSQIGFMNMFAIPLFQGVTDVMPGMEFAVNELQMNKSAWEWRIHEEQAKTRHDSDDSVTMDGVFSPRTMSLATTSAVSHNKTNTTSPSTARSSHDSEIRIKALLNKSPFSPPNGVLEESLEPPHNQLLPGFSTTSPTDSNPSPSDTTPDNSRRPSKLQVGYQNDPLENDNKGACFLGNTEGSTDLVTNPLFDHEANYASHEKHASSDTTEGSNYAHTEPPSQATSTTSNNMPLSPISQGTSIGSDTSLEKSQTPTPAALARHATPVTGTSVSPMNSSPEGIPARHEAYEGRSGAIMGTVRNLRKKPSRFRVNSLNFWKKKENKGDSPPVPVHSDGRDDKLALGSSDEVNHWR